MLKRQFKYCHSCHCKFSAQWNTNEFFVFLPEPIVNYCLARQGFAPDLPEYAICRLAARIFMVLRSQILFLFHVTNPSHSLVKVGAKHLSSTGT